MAGAGYGTIEGSAATPGSRSPRQVSKGLFAVSALLVVAAVVVIGYSASNGEVVPVERLQLVELRGPREAVMLRGTSSAQANRLSQLQEALDRIVEPARTFGAVDHAQLAQVLKEHLLAATDRQGHKSYPFGYDRSHGWHQEIENYSPENDGCDCAIDEGAAQLNCDCGSVWGAITLMDEGCYGCCETGCCHHCSCHWGDKHVYPSLDEEGTIEAPQGTEEGDQRGHIHMGATSCSCPLGQKWRWNSECNWWRDNAGPLDPGGTGGIPVVEDEPGILT